MANELKLSSQNENSVATLASMQAVRVHERQHVERWPLLAVCQAALITGKLNVILDAKGAKCKPVGMSLK